MVPTMTVFEHSPDRGRGLARDMGVRWAFEAAARRAVFDAGASG